MKRSSLPQVALAFLTTLTLIGCSATARQQSEAGARVGAATAKLVLERQPDKCGQTVPGPTVNAGDEARSIIARYGDKLGEANERIVDCYTFNENYRQRLIATTGATTKR